jgi:hypothetical protein
VKAVVRRTTSLVTAVAVVKVVIVFQLVPSTVSCTATLSDGVVPLAAVTFNCKTNNLAAANPVTAVPAAVVVLAADANNDTVLAGILACCISLMHFLL